MRIARFILKPGMYRTRLKPDTTLAEATPSEPGAVDWARDALGFEPDAIQARVLSSSTARGLLNCTRQWGKSTVTAAKAVHQAWSKPESLTLVVSPSARQSGEFLRKATAFTRRLKVKPKGDGDNESRGSANRLRSSRWRAGRGRLEMCAYVERVRDGLE